MSGGGASGGSKSGVLRQQDKAAAQARQRQQQQQLVDEQVSAHLQACELHLGELASSAADEAMHRPCAWQNPPHAQLPAASSNQQVQVGGLGSTSLWDPSQRGLDILLQLQQRQQQQRVQPSAPQLMAIQPPQQQDGQMDVDMQEAPVHHQHSSAVHCQELQRHQQQQQQRVLADEVQPWWLSLANTASEGIALNGIAQHMSSSEQQQQQHPAWLYKEEWGAGLRLSGAAAYRASNIEMQCTQTAACSSEAAAAAAAGQAAGSGADAPGCCSAVASMWRGSVWLKDIWEVQQLMQLPHNGHAVDLNLPWQSSAADSNSAVGNGVSLGKQDDRLDAAVCAAGCSVPAADAVTGSIRVRIFWLASRLLEAQGRLEAADAAGRLCLQELTRPASLQPQQQQQQKQQQSGPLSTAIEHPSRPTAVSMASGKMRPQYDAPVSLPSCQFDSVISTAAVREKLSSMWLKMELVAAEQKLVQQERVWCEMQKVVQELKEQRQHLEQQQALQQKHHELMQQVQDMADNVVAALQKHSLLHSIEGALLCIFTVCTQHGQA
jgi:hypothetical protein